MSRHRRTSMNNSIKDRLEDIKEWIAEHMKIVMPIILLVCVLITVVIAINANKKAEAEVQTAEVSEEPVLTEEAEAIPELVLEENAYPSVNTLMSNYYEALAAGDIDSITLMNAFVEDTEKIRIQEMSKYIDSYPQLDVYTKIGPVEGSYLVYVYSKVKFTEYDGVVPGMQAFYVCTDESGNCYINEGEDNSVVTNYIRDISLQGDVVDLNNKVAVEYNELLESDEELNAFLADLAKRIDVSVGEALAKAEAPVTETADNTETASTEETEEAVDTPETAEVPEETEANTVKTVRATDVVNVRSSDSETADKLGKAQTGDEFTLLEEKGNGWSKITFEGQDAYIKTQYLEVVSEEEAPADTAGTESTEEADTEAAEAAEEETTTSAGDGTYVTVVENVNVRKTASESGKKLGLAYIGEKLELVMKQADGWTKVKYKDQTAYVKSDFVE